MKQDALQQRHVINSDIVYIYKGIRLSFFLVHVCSGPGVIKRILWAIRVSLDENKENHIWHYLLLNTNIKQNTYVWIYIFLESIRASCFSLLKFFLFWGFDAWGHPQLFSTVVLRKIQHPHFLKGNFQLTLKV